MEKKDVSRIIDNYGDLLYRTVYVQVGNQHDTQDILQEVFIRYLEKSPVFKDEEHEKAWLLKVTHHLCIDFLRFRKKHRYLDLSQIEDVIVIPEDKQVIKELFQLPPKQKSVLILHYLEGYHIKEIAEIMGVSSNAVKKRLQRGREMLRKKLS